MILTKQFQELFNGTSVNQNRIDGSVDICRKTAIEYAEWIVEKQKQNPNSVLRYDKLFEIYEQQELAKNKNMIPPKQKAQELFGKIGTLLDLRHNEISEVLDFLLETKVIQEDIKTEDLEYWCEVRIEAKKIK